MMDFYDVLDQVLKLLQNRKRVAYRALKRQFDFDDDDIEALKDEFIDARRVAIDEAGKVLVWIDKSEEPSASVSPRNLVSVPEFHRPPEPEPLAYTPSYLADKILTSRNVLEGERKQVTVLFADIKDSTELIRNLDPEEAQKLLDPAIHIMMAAVHRFEGTVNQVLGDGVMSLFGAPIAHEDHAARACYAALAMQAAMRDYTDAVRRQQGLELRIRVGLNSGEVVVRTIGNDLYMDYSAVGPTTHLAARMEQLAAPGSIRLSSSTLRLVEGLVQVDDLGAIPVKGMDEPAHVYELIGASPVRRRLQAAVSRGLTQFVGRDSEMDALHHALELAGAGLGQIMAVVGEPGVGKSRLVYEFVHSHRTQGWLVLESAFVSYGKATPYFPVVDLLKRYVHVEDGDDARTIRAKVTGQIVTLDASLQDTIPALLSLLEALPEDSPFSQLDPPQRRRRTLDGLKRILLRQSQAQPLVLVFEDLHWHDSESQALLDSLVESLPTAPLLLLVNYRPEYTHGWGSKTYYTQLRLDPLSPASADALLEVLLGDHTSLEPLKQLLIERTEGNPFFLEESVQTLVETAVLAGEPGRYRLAQDLPTIQVPATVQAVLAARMDRLPPDEKRLLQTASVIGTEVPLPLLQAVAELPDERLYCHLAHLQAAAFLYETTLFPERVYTFTHALTQNVAYQSLLSGTRQQYHRQIAQVLETQFPEMAEARPELQAHHDTEAGLHAKAVDGWYKAARKAIERSAHVEGIGHLNRGLEVLTRLTESSERDQRELHMRTTLGRLLMLTEGHGAPEVELTFVRARALCQQLGDTEDLLPVLNGLWIVSLVRAELHQAHALAEEGLQLVQDRADPVLVSRAHDVLGETSLYLGKFTATRDHMEHCLTLYDPQQHQRSDLRYEGPSRGVNGLVFLARALWALGYPDQALAKTDAACDLAYQLDHPVSLAMALDFAAGLHLLRREIQRVQARSQVLLDLAQTQGLPFWEAWAKTLQGWVRAVQDKRQTGIAHMWEGLAGCRETGSELDWPWVLGLIAELYGQGRQTEDGLAALAEALNLVENTGERWYEAELHRFGAHCCSPSPQTISLKPSPASTKPSPSPKPKAPNPGNFVLPPAWLACGSPRASARRHMTCSSRCTTGSPKGSIPSASKRRKAYLMS